MQPKHIVILSDSARPTGGAEKVALDSALLLREHGCIVHFIAPDTPNIENDDKGIEFHSLSIQHLKEKGPLEIFQSGIWNSRVFDYCENLLNKLPRSQTLVHAHSWQRGLTAASLAAATASTKPLIITLHEFGIACPNQGFFNYQTRQICTKKGGSLDCALSHCDSRTYAHKLWRFSRLAAQRAFAKIPTEVSAFIYISELSRNLLSSYTPRDAAFFYVRNPIPIEKTERVRAESNEKFYFVGRITEEKGTDIFLSAMRAANLKAVIIGDGPMRVELQKKFPEAVFTGWLNQAEINDELSSARSVALPSRWYEGQPLVIQEALARGIPTIISNGTGAREVITNRHTGLLFDHMDSQSLAARAREISMSADLAQSISKNSYQQYWSDPPSPSNHLRDLLSVYERVLLAHEN